MVVYFLVFSLICGLFVRVDAIVGGLPADVAPEDDPVVYTRFAGRSARIAGLLDFPHYVFRGIRFAEPPTGRDRFQRPRQYFLQGEINATVHPPPCLQPNIRAGGVIGSEDCLFLNIFTPTLPDGTEGLPVVIWIHGGGFRIGSASQYGVKHLVGKRLVIVTIQYRLGSLGFLSTGTTEMPGNAGIWDMALAVQFVRNYIGFFGGNPHRIVVMGHGTGASSALILSLSKIAKGLTSGVVAMSGTGISHGAIDEKPVNTAYEIAEQNGCPTVNALIMIRCLQNLPPASIIQTDSKLEQSRLQSRGFVSGLSGLLTPAPATEGEHDGRSLPSLIERKPLDDMYNKQIPKIPLLTGVTKDETKKAVEGHYKDEIVTKLKSIPHFLDQVLVKNLQNLTGLGKIEEKVSSLWSHLDPLQFRNYLQVKRNDFVEGLHKISEATGDALFNLPAFLTVDLWSKHGMPTFLYSFEHSGKARKGYEFLDGLPIVGNSTSGVDDAIAHGDDLGYLFDARNLDGTPLETEERLDRDDLEVREFFTQMISDFARHGHLNFENKKIPNFSPTQNNFIEISAKPKLSHNFRYCQMALWAGLAERLHSASCKFLKVLDSQVKNVENVLFDTIGGGKISAHHNDTKSEGIGKIAKPLGVLKPHRKNENNEKGRLLGGVIG